MPPPPPSREKITWHGTSYSKKWNYVNLLKLTYNSKSNLLITVNDYGKDYGNNSRNELFLYLVDTREKTVIVMLMVMLGW